MSPYGERILEGLHNVEGDLTRHVAGQQRRWSYRVHRGRVWFDEEVRQAHRQLRQSIPSYIREGSVQALLTAPVIYSLILPLLLLDAWITIYQRVCFPIYGIARVPRGVYLVFDRRRLSYLNGIEKANCTFCGYANGMFAYAREVAARTEQYWCPIKHARSTPAPHARYRQFIDFGDAEGYRRQAAALRHALRRERDRRDTSRGRRTARPR